MRDNPFEKYDINKNKKIDHTEVDEVLENEQTAVIMQELSDDLDTLDYSLVSSLFILELRDGSSEIHNQLVQLPTYIQMKVAYGNFRRITAHENILLDNDATIDYFHAILVNNDQSISGIEGITAKITNLNNEFSWVKEHALDKFKDDVALQVFDDLLLATGLFVNEVDSNQNMTKIRSPYWNWKTMIILDRQINIIKNLDQGLVNLTTQLSRLKTNENQLYANITQLLNDMPGPGTEFLSILAGPIVVIDTQKHATYINSDTNIVIQQLITVKENIRNTQDRIESIQQQQREQFLTQSLLQYEFVRNNNVDKHVLGRMVFQIFLQFDESEIRTLLQKETLALQGIEIQTILGDKATLPTLQRSLLATGSMNAEEYTAFVDTTLSENFGLKSIDKNVGENSIKRVVESDIIDLVYTNEEIKKKKFPAGSDIDENLNDGRVVWDEVVRGDDGVNLYPCTKVLDSGEIQYFYVQSDGTLRFNNNRKYSISVSEQNRNMDIKQFLQTSWQEHPGIEQVQDYFSTFGPSAQHIQKLLEIDKEKRTSKNKAYVSHISLLATELKDHRRGRLQEIPGRKKDIESWITHLQMVKGHMGDVTRRYSGTLDKDIQEQLDYAHKLKEGLIQMEQFLAGIDNIESMSDDDLMNRCITNGIVILTVIAVATLSVMTCGAGAVGFVGLNALLWNSAVIATGSLVGKELGQLASTGVGRMVYDESYDNRGMLTKYIRAQASGDDTNLKNRLTGEDEITISKMIGQYGIERVQGFLLGFAAMGLAQLGVKYLTAFRQNNIIAPGRKGNIAMKIDKLQNYFSETMDLATTNGLRNQVQRFMKEYSEELFEEGFGDVAGKAVEGFSTKLGFATSFFAELLIGMRKGKINYSIGGGSFDITRIPAGTFMSGKIITTTYQTNDTLLFSDLQTAYPDAIVTQKDGNIEVRIDDEHGTGYAQVMIFIQTEQSYIMRKLHEDNPGIMGMDTFVYAKDTDGNDVVMIKEEEQGKKIERTKAYMRMLEAKGFVIVPIDTDTAEQNRWRVRWGNEHMILTTDDTYFSEQESQNIVETEALFEQISAIDPKNNKQAILLMGYYEQLFVDRTLTPDQLVVRNRNYARACTFLRTNRRNIGSEQLAREMNDVYYAMYTGKTRNERGGTDVNSIQDGKKKVWEGFFLEKFTTENGDVWGGFGKTEQDYIMYVNRFENSFSGPNKDIVLDKFKTVFDIATLYFHPYITLDNSVYEALKQTFGEDAITLTAGEISIESSPQPFVIQTDQNWYAENIVPVSIDLDNDTNKNRAEIARNMSDTVTPPDTRIELANSLVAEVVPSSIFAQLTQDQKNMIGFIALQSHWSFNNNIETDSDGNIRYRDDLRRIPELTFSGIRGKYEIILQGLQILQDSDGNPLFTQQQIGDIASARMGAGVCMDITNILQAVMDMTPAERSLSAVVNNTLDISLSKLDDLPENTTIQKVVRVLIDLQKEVENAYKQISRFESSGLVNQNVVAKARKRLDKKVDSISSEIMLNIINMLNAGNNQELIIDETRSFFFTQRYTTRVRMNNGEPVYNDEYAIIENMRLSIEEVIDENISFAEQTAKKDKLKYYKKTIIAFRGYLEQMHVFDNDPELYDQIDNAIKQIDKTLEILSQTEWDEWFSQNNIDESLHTLFIRNPILKKYIDEGYIPGHELLTINNVVEGGNKIVIISDTGPVLKLSKGDKTTTAKDIYKDFIDEADYQMDIVKTIESARTNGEKISVTVGRNNKYELDATGPNISIPNIAPSKNHREDLPAFNEDMVNGYDINYRFLARAAYTDMGRSNPFPIENKRKQLTNEITDENILDDKGLIDQMLSNSSVENESFFKMNIYSHSQLLQDRRFSQHVKDFDAILAQNNGLDVYLGNTYTSLLQLYILCQVDPLIANVAPPLWLQACATLKYLYNEKGYIHTDFHENNSMLEVRDGQVYFNIIDLK